MRSCDTQHLALKPFAADGVALVVGDDRVARKVELGGAGHFESFPTLTLFISPDEGYPIGSKLTVNLLPAARPANAATHFESSESIAAPRIAESRVAFECVVVATGSLDGEHARNTVVVARVLASHQRWPRGCAIT
jgi:hypothetical protein